MLTVGAKEGFSRLRGDTLLKVSVEDHIVAHHGPRRIDSRQLNVCSDRSEEFSRNYYKELVTPDEAKTWTGST